MKLVNCVAPRVGAWIETSCFRIIISNAKSHPEWVRGLKHHATDERTTDTGSHPEWVRGLKRK